MVNRKEIMDIAIELWQKRGYRNVSVEEICRNLNVTKGSFYHHFSSKRELLIRYYLEKTDEELKTSLKSIQKETSSIAAVKKIYRVYTGGIATLSPELVMGILSKNDAFSLHHNDFYDGIPDLMEKELKSAILHGQKEKEIRTDLDADVLLELVTYSLFGIAINWCYTDRSFDIFQKDDLMIDVLLKDQSLSR